jgi:WD40 repeat protein
LWESDTGKCLKTLTIHNDYVKNLAYSKQNAHILASSGLDGQIFITDLHAMNVMTKLLVHDDEEEDEIEGILRLPSIKLTW